MTATDACLMRLGFRGGGFDTGCRLSVLLFSVGRSGRTLFNAARELGGLVRPEVTASRE